MFKELPFHRSHLDPMLSQRINSGLGFGLAQLIALESGDSRTFFYNDVPQICGGIVQYWNRRGHVWSVFNEDCKQNFVPTFRAVKKWLNKMIEEKYNRLELSIACDLMIAHRRAHLLGFDLEVHRAKKFLPDGTDCSLYSITRGASHVG